MTRIKIKNFGPIQGSDDSWIDIKKVTVLIGTQGSGKSTVAKLISTFSWIEKALVRGDYEKSWFERKGKFKNQYLSYHRIEGYLSQETDIAYQGDAYHIRYVNDTLRIEENKCPYSLPQIIYIPAERNFLAYIRGVREIKMSGSLVEFNTEYEKAKNEMQGILQLPVNDIEVEYNKRHAMLYLKGSRYKIKLSDASSGFQSSVPLYLVSAYLAKSVKAQRERGESMSSEEQSRFQKGVQEIWQNTSLTDEQRRIALSALSTKFNKSALINIVEEPEQNLYPVSQWSILKSLLELNNENPGSKLIMTTHSPYLINYLSVVIKAGKVRTLVNSSDLIAEAEEIVPSKSMVDADDVAIYEFEEDGSVHRLETYNGLPSDENKLNANLDETNELFGRLINIQQRR
jgi:predicted ATPase